MTPKRKGSAETRVVDEGGRVQAPTEPDPNPAEPDPVEDVPVERRGPLTGRLIDGRYQIMELIGEGGMGVVYRAVHTLMDKELAFKVLLPEYTAMEGLAKRFQQEAQSASRLDHPGIIQVFDFGETDDNQLYLVMAYLHGRSLTEVMETESPLPTERSLTLAVQICNALAHAHAQGVVHRDLKPDNVMIVPRDDGTEQVKLLDFGIAKITQGEGAATGLTEVGAIFGTPEYLSPEQAAGDPVDHRTDVYSLGVILYEMLSGQKLFSADTNVKYLYAHMHSAPKPLTTLVPKARLSPALDEVVLRALTKNPNERYQTAVELSEALARATSQPALAAFSGVVAVDSGPLPPVEGDANRAPTAGGARLTLPPLTQQAEDKRKMVVWGLGVAVGALVVLVMALSLVLSDEDDDKPVGKKVPKVVKVVKVVKGPAAAAKRADDGSLLVVSELIAQKKFADAEQRLNEIARVAPKDPRVHLHFGHLHCRRSAAEACLASYNMAVVLDRASRADTRLVANLQRLLVKKRGKLWGRTVRERSVAFAVQAYTKGELQPPVVKMLTQFANKWWEQDLIWQVIEVLMEHDAALGVDWVHAYTLRFRSVDSCELRKKYIQEIVARKDKKLLPVLDKVYAEVTLKKPWSKKRVSNACVAQDAAKAIKALGGKLPAQKAAMKAATTPPQRRRSGGIRGQVRRYMKRLKRR